MLNLTHVSEGERVFARVGKVKTPIDELSIKWHAKEGIFTIFSIRYLGEAVIYFRSAAEDDGAADTRFGQN